jgi:hypothetical protein
MVAVPATQAAPEVTPNETVIRLTVQPMAAPRPALKYLLLPELKEMSPGNPISAYLQCLVDQDFTTDNETLTKTALRQADRAARLDKPDWQVLLKAKSDGFNLLLPDVQKMRTLAAALQERFRSEAKQGRFDDAIATCKTMFALSRHLGEHPTLIGDRVAVALALITIGPLEEMLEQPGCPNLYWALTNLPNPLVSFEKGMEGERLIVGTELKDLSASAPMTPAELKKVMDYIDKLIGSDDKSNQGRTRLYVETRVKDPIQVVNARERLVEFGIPEKTLLTFPPEQVILLDGKREFEVERDEVLKLMNLPSWQFLEVYKKAKTNKPKTESVFGIFQSAYEKIRLAQARLEQKIAILRHVEAVRMYAADHKGAVPAKLDDCPVPLPVDPMTGKPFRYAVEAGVAHLRGNPPPGYETVAVYNLHYEIRVGSRQ